MTRGPLVTHQGEIVHECVEGGLNATAQTSQDAAATEPDRSGVSTNGTDLHDANLEVGLYIFILAGFLGYHVITRVPPLLHTPLMSATNAISGISLIGSLVVAGADARAALSTFLGFVAVACSSTNVVGGFLITDRMLKMFKKRAGRRPPGGLAAARLDDRACVAAVVRRTGRRRLVGLVTLHAIAAHARCSRYLYIVSAVLFILGLKGLSSPKCARRGMFLAELRHGGGHRRHAVSTPTSSHWGTSGSSSACSSAPSSAASMGLRIPMTAVPQRTALSHSLGALAATLVGISEYLRTCTARQRWAGL